MSISYSQPYFFFNPIRWESKASELLYEESKRGYIESIEQIAINTIERYFKLLEAQIDSIIYIQNFNNADTLLKITELKFSIGTRDKNDLLQARLNLLNAKNNVATGKLNLQSSHQAICQYLNFARSTALELNIPEKLQFFNIDYNLALQQAKQNRQEVIEYRRRRLEAQRNLAEAKAMSGPNFTLNANLGLSQANERLIESYRDLQRQQSVAVQFSIPLVDRGANKARRMRAKADLELTINGIEQDEREFEQEIQLQIAHWNILESQMSTAQQTRAVSFERYNVAKERYLLGTISFTEFMNAQVEKDYAALLYITKLKSYWISYLSLK